MSSTTVGASAKPYVWATTGVAALGTAWCLAYVGVSAGTGAITYLFAPDGGVFASGA